MTQVLGEEICKAQSFSVESFFTNLFGKLFEEIVVSLLRIREYFTKWPNFKDFGMIHRIRQRFNFYDAC